MREGYLSSLTIKANGAYKFLCIFLFPAILPIERWWLDIVLVIFVVAISSTYVFLNVRLRKIHERQRDLFRSLINQQENERKRIAAELHDSIAQTVLMIKNTALIGAGLKKSPSKMVGRFTEISGYASQTLQDIRQISQSLRPVLLDYIGLTESLRHLVETISSDTSLHITASIDQIDNLLKKEAEINFYRIIHESLNNIVTQAHATKAEITIKKDGQTIRILIDDNGNGMEISHVPIYSDNALGMVGIEERIKMLDGTWHIKSLAGSGTSTQIEIHCNHP
jgi:signal transduction histidine kinase